MKKCPLPLRVQLLGNLNSLHKDLLLREVLRGLEVVDHSIQPRVMLSSRDLGAVGKIARAVTLDFKARKMQAAAAARQRRDTKGSK
jgi:hypothetical protein